MLLTNEYLYLFLGYEQLTCPTRSAGLAQPLQDITVLNIAGLLQHMPEVDIKQPPFTRVNRHSMNYTDHGERAVQMYYTLTNEAPPPEAPIKELLSQLKKLSTAPLDALKTHVQQKHNREKAIDEKSAMLFAKQILTNTNKLPASLPAALRMHVFRMIRNALPTWGRIRYLFPRAPREKLLCKLCNREQESILHLLTNCQTTYAAAERIIRLHSNQPVLSFLSEMEADDVNFRTSVRSQEELLYLLIFSLAIWRTRGNYYDRTFSDTTPLTATYQIADQFQKLVSLTTAKKACRKRDRKREKGEFLRELAKLPHLSARAFTDGSAMGKPTIGGAGITYKLGPNRIRSYSSACLGRATNNVAELTAEQMLFDLVYVELTNDVSIPRLPLYVFVDNQYAINAAEGKIRTRANAVVVKKTQQALVKLRQIIPVTLIWVPGHAGVIQNEIADGLAKRGAKGITSKAPFKPKGKPNTKSNLLRVGKAEVKRELNEYDLELADEMVADEEEASDEDSPALPALPAQHAPSISTSLPTLPSDVLTNIPLEEPTLQMQPTQARRSIRKRKSRQGTLFAQDFFSVQPIQKRRCNDTDEKLGARIVRKRKGAQTANFTKRVCRQTASLRNTSRKRKQQSFPSPTPKKARLTATLGSPNTNSDEL